MLLALRRHISAPVDLIMARPRISRFGTACSIRRCLYRRRRSNRSGRGGAAARSRAAPGRRPVVQRESERPGLCAARRPSAPVSRLRPRRTTGAGNCSATSRDSSGRQRRKAPNYSPLAAPCDRAAARSMTLCRVNSMRSRKRSPCPPSPASSTSPSRCRSMALSARGRSTPACSDFAKSRGRRRSSRAPASGTPSARRSCTSRRANTSPPQPTDYHPALVVDDIDAWRARFAEHDVDISDQPTIYNRRRFDVRDPFGNRIEIMTEGDAT